LMAIRANIYNSGTGGLYEIVDSTRVLPSNGPKWLYYVRSVVIQIEGVNPSPLPGTNDVIAAYNVWELDNTVSTWFGLPSSEYKGLEFNPAPAGTIVFGHAPAEEMVDASLTPANLSQIFLLFNYPNQLSGECT